MGCMLCCRTVWLQALKINVDMLKLIQLGLTFTNAGGCVREHTEFPSVDTARMPLSFVGGLATQQLNACLPLCDSAVSVSVYTRGSVAYTAVQILLQCCA